MRPERVDPNALHPSLPEGSRPRRWPRLRAAGRTLASLLLGGLAVLGAVAIVRLGLVPLIETMFAPGDAWLSIFRRIGIVLAALLAYWAYVRWHEKRGATELRLQPLRLLLGGAGGAVMVGLPIALLFALGAYELLLWRGFSPALLGVAGLIGIAAFLEELVYRCLLFRVMERTWGTVFALVAQAAIFAVGHMENVVQGAVGDAVAMLVSVTLLGLLWAGLFVLTRNLWVVAAHHAAWNFTILLSGVPLSGIEDWRALAPLESRYAGPDWLTGGMFGPESSLLVIVITGLAVLWLLRFARRRGAFQAPVV
jgi:membrane protease YdiL (CAAX protease family)